MNRRIKLRLALFIVPFIFLMVSNLSNCTCKGQIQHEELLQDSLANSSQTKELLNGKDLDVLSDFTDTSIILRFFPEILNFESDDSLNQNRVIDIVFTGSSSIRRWKSLLQDIPGYKVLNRGFGGSTIPEVIYFSDELIFRHHPKKIVFYAGENDMANPTGDTLKVVESFIYFYELVEEKLPAAHIYFISLKPSPARMDYWPGMKSVNSMVEEFCKTKNNCTFIDISAEMFTSQNQLRKELFVKDGIHLNQLGYQVWKKKINNQLKIQNK